MTAGRRSLDAVFRPRTVAVVGASRGPGIGRAVFERLLDARFEGAVYPVNPAARAIAGVRAYPSVRDVPDAIDLAVVAVPAPAVLEVAHECAACGAGALVVLSAGFAESGDAGRAMQDELLRVVRGAGMRLVGPNCLGVLNTAGDVRLNATFGRPLPQRGRIAMASQSGAMGLALFDYAERAGAGIAAFASIGNRADVSSNDLIRYWGADGDVGVIALYLESFGNPRRFSRTARRVARTKPVVAVKSGRTAAGSRAARSHTAALAGSEVAVDALLRQAGVLRVETLEELFAVLALLEAQPLPEGERVAVVSNAGGPGIVAADALEAAGMRLADLDERTVEAIAGAIPRAASARNPVDLIAAATPEDYAAAIERRLLDPNVDALIAINVAVSAVRADRFARAIRAGADRAFGAGARRRPVLATFMSAGDRPPGLAVGADEASPAGTIPAYAFPETAAQALGHARRYAQWRAAPPGEVRCPPGFDVAAVRRLSRAFARGPERWLEPHEVEALLAAASIPTPRATVAATPGEAADAAGTLGFPVAVKVRAPGVLHKSDVGGVALGLGSPEEVRAACEGMLKRVPSASGFLVQQMARPGVEVLAGITSDPLFGPLVAAGLGGTEVEVLRDVAFRLTPLTDADAAGMLRSLRGFPLLNGYRGRPPADVEAVEDLLLRASWLARLVPPIDEMDLNPVRVFPRGEGLQALDARIHLRPARRPRPARPAAPDTRAGARASTSR